MTKHGKVTWIDQDSVMNNDSWMRQAEAQMRDYWGSE